MKLKKVVEYEIKPQSFGRGFKVTEKVINPNENQWRRRMLAKGLTMSEADNLVYQLERGKKK